MADFSRGTSNRAPPAAANRPRQRQTGPCMMMRDDQHGDT